MIPVIAASIQSSDVVEYEHLAARCSATTLITVSPRQRWSISRAAYMRRVLVPRIRLSKHRRPNCLSNRLP
jgi:hypothetical protein